jgi:hypothetical protein
MVHYNSLVPPTLFAAYKIYTLGLIPAHSDNLFAFY